MKYSDILSQSLTSRNINGIRAALIGYLDLSTGCNTPCAVADSVARDVAIWGDTLYDTDDRRHPFILNPDQADQDLIKLKALLRTNFSREKFAFGEKLLGLIQKRKLDIVQPTVLTKTMQQVTSSKEAINQSKIADKQAFTLPVDLNNAVEAKNRSAVMAILMGYLDVFDKTEDLPVIQYAALCNDKFKEYGIQLFDSDDGRVELQTVPLTGETLITLKAKLRLNFSLEKLIVAERIFQMKMDEKRSAAMSSALKEETPEVKIEQSIYSSAEKLEKNDNSASAENNDFKTEDGERKQLPPISEQKVPKAADAKTNEESQDSAKNSRLNSPSKEGKTSADIRKSQEAYTTCYHPGLLESLFGQIGKMFDTLFDPIFHQKGRNVRRPKR